MSISISNGSNNVFEQINQTNQSGSSQDTSKSEESQMFMRLMIAQLKNQDPTNPADTTDFMQQISTMSQVESINKLVTSVDSMKSEMAASQAAIQASTFVGKNVFVEGDIVEVGEESNGKAVLNLEGVAQNVKVRVFDAYGNEVTQMELGQLNPGTHQIEVPAGDFKAGTYQLKIESANDISEFSTLNVAQEVVSVSFGKNGSGMTINTNFGRYGLNDIEEVG